MPINDDDLLLINDGTETQTITFAQLKDGSMLNDTDKFLVNDGTKTETLTWAQFQQEIITPPEIGSVVLSEDEPENSHRFTNEAFTTTIVMADEGTPEGTKSIRGWVLSDLTLAIETDEIIDVDPNNADLPPTTWSVAPPATLKNPANAFNGLLSTTTAGGGNNATAASNPGQPISVALIGVFDPGIPFNDSIGAIATINGNAGNEDFDASSDIRMTIDGVEYTFQNGDLTQSAYPGANAAFREFIYRGSGVITRIEVHSHEGFSCGLDGIELDEEGLLTDGKEYPILTFKTDKHLAYLETGETLTQEDSAATGKITRIDVANKQVEFISFTGTWGPANSGHYGIGPTKTVNDVRQYLVLDSNRNVTALQSA